eukprot:TRINITY_DN6_c0_g2_i1.p1 TRINITY_DN6_c0_g2~~TRINITY_DN6_c0_g2_i1.p1  ORF type:complete len:700 (-),score=310.89 TRINITY_DN6_c0_g2_i1:110-2209(-)
MNSVRNGVLCGLIANAAVRAEETNPLAQVLKLCDELSAKVKADGEAEAKAYKEYYEWCDDVAKEKQFEIKTSTSEKESLEAKIKELAATVEEEETKISELAEKISTNDGDLKKATEIREKEASDFATAEKELVETVDTLTRAVGILEKELGKGGAALAQVQKSVTLKNAMQALSAVMDAAAFSIGDKQKLTALVQAQQSADSDDEDSESAPAAAAYESKAGSIVDVLADMQEKAETQLSELRKAETTYSNNYKQLKQGLEDQLSYDNSQMETSKSNKAAAEESKATGEGELSVTKEDLGKSSEALEQTQKGCMQVASDFEASMASRAEELKVIAQAVKILEDTTNGAASFLQTGVEKTDAKFNIVKEVKALAKKHHSAALAQLASRVAAVVGLGDKVADPFAKIKGMIEDMITKLESEASEEATEKAYCDDEMAKTKAKKEELDADVSKLTTEIDQATARSTELKEQVSTLQSELAAATKEQAESDKVRKEEHDVYTKEKADLELALGGMRKALDVLRNYYAKGESLIQDGDKFNSFMQQPAPPQSHSASGGAGGSIINILEVAESDTAENLAKVETEEADAQAAYDEALQEFKITKVSKEQDVKYKTQEFTGLDKTVTDLSGDRDTTSTELAAVNEYYAKLEERCVAKPETYEERKKRRDEEIQGLKEALQTLDSVAAFTQRGSKRRSGRHMRGSLTA